ncbi:MAG: LLM class flavin-dependent oxidoreductase [Betaproteobacteria bacterium]|nr:LLM class flavin-dependent oxidoreductase [Betaproteobacteria bacterium]
MPIDFAFKLNVHGHHPDTPFERYIDLACHAEAAGFSAVYVIDHLLLPADRLVGITDAEPSRPYFLDCWCTLAAVAARTRKIRLGPQVTPIGLRHPVFVAKWGATIDRISNGRLSLGVGLGHQEVEYVSHGFPYPPFKERFERMMEGVEIIRRLWTEDAPVTYQGKHYSVQDVTFWPKPAQSPPPIFFGGTSPSIRRGVARLGDGWSPAAPQLGGFSPAFYQESLAAIRADAASRGRTGSIRAGALFHTAISEDAGEIERAAAMLRRKPAYSGRSVDEINQTGVVMMGTPEQVGGALEPYVEAGVEEFTMSFVPMDDLDLTRRGIDLYARKVMPRFKR